MIDWPLVALWLVATVAILIVITGLNGMLYDALSGLADMIRRRKRKADKGWEIVVHPGPVRNQLIIKSDSLLTREEADAIARRYRTDREARRGPSQTTSEAKQTGEALIRLLKAGGYNSETVDMATRLVRENVKPDELATWLALRMGGDKR